MTPSPNVESFIQRWTASGAAERANYQLFLTELCTLVEVPPPEPTRPDDADNAYVFERNVHFLESDGSTSIGRIDLYKRGAFVLEAKQGSDAAADDPAAVLLPEKTKRAKRRGTAVRGTASWDDAMVRARGQADRYARALPASEGWPPFLIVVDVGHSIELYSEFGRSGKTYVPFPDPKSFRILLGDLCREEVRQRLRQVWLDPLSLDPSRRSAKVTRQLAERLAALARLLEKAGHDPEDVARFLMRCLFTMFAEDIDLIPAGSFKDLLGRLVDAPENFKPTAEELWRTMNSGGFSLVLQKRLARFNGGLFAESQALPLTRPMLTLLHEAAEADWTDVEPAIFGTLLERALDPVERHKLGAHYTPRAYVERLVLPTVIEPLREEWQAAYAAALSAARQGDLAAARETVHAFHEQLCKTRVLDPACGSGNFLYVTLEQMKRLEGEVLNALREFGDTQQILFEVDPHQFLGIEINPRAAAIAELVLWIGYLQWHFRTRGHATPAEPIIKNYKNIECRDAVLAWDRKEMVLDEHCKPVTRWDGRTMKKHPVTGEDVPDESARTLVERYINPRKAQWPAAEYVVGNPPFLGKLHLLTRLGEGYVDALREAYDSEVGGGCDFVMYWWFNAARKTGSDFLKSFGFISTTTISQAFNRQILADALSSEPALHLAFAIPNHPWVDAEEGAAVRIAMTVVRPGQHEGVLASVIAERDSGETHRDVDMALLRGVIHEDLRIGAHSAKASQLKANALLSGTGLILGGRGFVLSQAEADSLRATFKSAESIVFPLRNGRDLTDVPRNVFVIDTCGLSDGELLARYPAVYQRLRDRVLPEREQNRDPRLRREWWLFRRSNEQIRAAIAGLPRYIATSETARHRLFVFLSASVKPEHKLVVIGSDDAFVLGILSSRPHVCWALRTGGRRGVGNDPVYSKTVCFECFPFPSDEQSKSKIRDLAEQLDAHRKRQQALHPKLTLTDMYNVLAKLRAGEELTAKEKTIHEQGLVSVLRQIHDDLDAAVFEAYGWPASLSDDEILERLVALNAQRAAEEAQGLVRWLRPEFQNPAAADAKQQSLSLVDDEDEQPAAEDGKRKASSEANGRRAGRRPGPARGEADGDAAKKPAAGKHPWPKGRAAQAKAVLAVLRECAGPVGAEELAQRFHRAQREVLDELLQALVTLGQARRTRGGKYTG
jgi:hypothetical protein